MGERLIYHSSVGFAICVAFLLCKGAEKIRSASVSKWSLAAFMIIIIVLSGFKTITRNRNWVNDNSLFSADIKTVPNSVLVTGNVAAADITLSDYQPNDSLLVNITWGTAIGLLDHALSIHRTFCLPLSSTGAFAWFKLASMDTDKARANIEMGMARANIDTWYGRYTPPTLYYRACISS